MINIVSKKALTFIKNKYAGYQVRLNWTAWKSNHMPMDHLRIELKCIGIEINLQCYNHELCLITVNNLHNIRIIGHDKFLYYVDIIVEHT